MSADTEHRVSNMLASFRDSGPSSSGTNGVEVSSIDANPRLDRLKMQERDGIGMEMSDKEKLNVQLQKQQKQLQVTLINVEMKFILSSC